MCETGPSATRAPGKMSADSALQPASDMELATGLANFAWTDNSAKHMLSGWLLRARPKAQMHPRPGGRVQGVLTER